MAIFSCISALVGKKKKCKKESLASSIDWNKDHGSLKVKLEHLASPYKKDGMNSTSFKVRIPFRIQRSSKCEVQAVKVEKLIQTQEVETPYKCRDQHDESTSVGKDPSDFDVYSYVAIKENKIDPLMNRRNTSYQFIPSVLNDGSERDEDGIRAIQCSHTSDIGIRRGEYRGSRRLKRSCSNLETYDVLKKITNQLQPSSSMEGEREVTQGIQTSPLSVMTYCSADRMMLRTPSSSEILPSTSRGLWWKLFIQGRRNLHKPLTAKCREFSVQNTPNQKHGYSLDASEPTQSLAARKLELRGSLNGKCLKKSRNNCRYCVNVPGGVSSVWLQNQWFAFSFDSSPLSRVHDWLNSLDFYSVPRLEENQHGNGDDQEKTGSIIYPPSPEICELPEETFRMTHDSKLNHTEVVKANTIVRRQNSLSTVANIANMGLEVIPNISLFITLRSINLSGNSIVHITQGSLPKSLRALNLSRNKILTLEGLRELTRLQVLDLSHNLISRIGHGLSMCTLIKELYLTGNKLNDVEGLHRMLKLKVLDLSFNKITEAKGLGSLMANYDSLLVLNLLGNPIQKNVGEEQLRKAVTSLIPRLAYLNRQPIELQRAREAGKDHVVKAALGGSRWNSRRKVLRRVRQGSSSVDRRSGEEARKRNQKKVKEQ